MAVKTTDVPLADRWRERLMRQGLQALSDADLVAVQLGSRREGSSALDIARRLLTDWGSLSGWPRLGSRLTLLGEGIALSTSEDIARVAQPLIGRTRTEQVAVLVADGGLRLKRAQIIASGTAKACPMPMRQVFATVLRHDACLSQHVISIQAVIRSLRCQIIEPVLPSTLQPTLFDSSYSISSQCMLRIGTLSQCSILKWCSLW